MRWQEWFVIWALVIMLAVGASIVVAAVTTYQKACTHAPAPSWAPPDVSLCPDSMDLWTCIQMAAYRKDI